METKKAPVKPTAYTATMKSDSDDKGSLVVGLFILGGAITTMIYCGIRQLIETMPTYGIRDVSSDQVKYMRGVRRRNLSWLWYNSRTEDTASAA